MDHNKTNQTIVILIAILLICAFFNRFMPTFLTFRFLYQKSDHRTIIINAVISLSHHERVDKLEINANLDANTLKQKYTLKQITLNYYWIHILCGDFFLRTFFPTEIFSLCVVNFMIPLKIEREFECNVTRLIALPFTSSNRLKVLIDCHWAAFNSNENWLHFECDRMCGLVMS